MTNPSTHHHPARAARPGRAAVPTVSVTATQLGEHLGLTRQRIGVLADIEHVIERLPNGRFNQDDCRLRYLRWLRDPARRSARSEAAAAHPEAKTQLLRIRIEEKQRKLVRRADVDALIDQIAGTVLTHLSSLPARCAPRGDLAIRRSIERVVFEVRTEIAKVYQDMADKCGEPPLSEQA
jgi:hypothetical protein